MRLYSYLFHFVLALFLLGISAVVFASGNHNLRLRMLPWSGEDLTQWVFWGSIFGLLAVLLAITGWFRFLFPLWALLVFVMLVRGYFWSPYTFNGNTEFKWVLALVAGALLALLGSLTVFRSRYRRA